jgi:ABC-type nitrate/sulfonate/bicarbonate transport system permease component
MKRRRALSVVTVVAVLAMWQVAVDQGWLRAIRFPPPLRLVASAWDLSVAGFPAGTLLTSHVAVTCLRILSGFLLALLLAVPLGLLIGARPLLDRATAPLVAFCRSVATLSLLPLAVVWFGTGEESKIFLIFYGCFWVILANAIDAIKRVDPVLIAAARTMDTPARALFFKVVLPAALPRLVSGARIALGVGFMVIVGAEMIGTTTGLGALIMEARNFYRSDITVVGMVVIGAIGFLLSGGLSRLESWLLPWQARERGRSA